MQVLKIAVLLSLGVALSSCSSSFTGKKSVRIAKGGAAQCVIVNGENPTASDKLAVTELALHLEKITGAKFQVVAEKDVPAGKPALYVGRTEFAEKAGLDFSKFGEEEWCERSIGGSLIIGGGFPRGALYGVYDFLENQLGCHWLSYDCGVIPKTADLRVSGLDVRGKPALQGREIYDAFWARKPPPEDIKNHKAFQIRNRNNSESPDRTWLLSMSKSRSFYHTFHWYVSPKIYAESHPEYFSDDGTGKRLLAAYPMLPGTQLCLSNREVWKIALDSLRKFIKEDRAKFPKEEWPIVYDISQMDGADFICKCKDCLAVVAREGSESGLVLEFINHIAEEISKEYPEIWIRTFAYVYTEKPPKNVKPGGNVIIQYCDLYGASDCYKPLLHPINKGQLEKLKSWCAITPNVFLWDYWFLGDRSVAPDLFIDALYADFNLFADLRLRGIFAESEDTAPGRCGFNDKCFLAMQHWLGYQLMLNPRRPLEPLIDLFIDNYYGAAAPVMKRYFNDLREAVRREPDKMWYTRKYLTADFLVTCRGYLRQATAACHGNPQTTPRVQRELTVIDNCLLSNWDRFSTELQTKKLLKDEVVAEYKNAKLALIEAYVRKESIGQFKEELASELSILSFQAPPLPAQFARRPKEQVKDFAWPYAIQFGQSAATSAKISNTLKYMVADPDSPVGKATVFCKKDPAAYVNPPVFGIYDRASKRSGPTVKISPVPTDEKYHWYKIPAFEFGSGTILWGHDSWLLSMNLYSAYVFADGVAGNPNLWETWVSVKVTGPALVPGSGKENGIWLDRVILTKPGRGDAK